MPVKKLKIKCPKCSEGISIPDSDDTKIFIKCDSCGTKGHIRNPKTTFEKTISAASEGKVQQEDDIDNTEKKGEPEEPISIDCPQCGEDIVISQSINEKVKIRCSSCGANGEIPNPYIEESEEIEVTTDMEVEVELLECPKCEGEIEVPYSPEERVIVQCKSCGAMGSINNPHLLKKELEDEEDTDEDHEHAIGLESESSKGLLETINCPKCKVEIDVPYSEDNKLKIKCLSCGAKGQISNPYL